MWDLDSSGPFRILKYFDELYIIGHGVCCLLDANADVEALVEVLARAKAADEFFRAYREESDAWTDLLSKNSGTLK